MTIGYIICMLAIALGVFVVGAYIAWYKDSSVVAYIVALLVAALVLGALFAGGKWFYSNTAMGARALKDEQSNLSNGLPREITITAEDGREIFHYVGKCDIETNTNYILFEGEDGLRRMIYYGRLDTIIIEELPEK